MPVLASEKDIVRGLRATLGSAATKHRERLDCIGIQRPDTFRLVAGGGFEPPTFGL